LSLYGIGPSGPVEIDPPQLPLEAVGWIAWEERWVEGRRIKGCMWRREDDGTLTKRFRRYVVKRWFKVGEWNPTHGWVRYDPAVPRERS
jgi:hypothetical protein